MCCCTHKELNLGYDLSVAELDEADPGSMTLLAAYLFTTLPQLLPRAMIEFECKLGEQQVQLQWKVAHCAPVLHQCLIMLPG